MSIFRRIKKNFRKKLAAALIAGAFVLSATQVSAADVVNVTLDETIQRAFENNRTIKESIAEREAAYWNLSEARRRSNPTLSWQWNLQRFGGSAYRYYDYDYHTTSDHDVGISMPIYQGGRLKEGRRSARYALSSADLALENTMQTVF